MRFNTAYSDARVRRRLIEVLEIIGEGDSMASLPAWLGYGTRLYIALGGGNLHCIARTILHMAART